MGEISSEIWSYSDSPGGCVGWVRRGGTPHFGFWLISPKPLNIMTWKLLRGYIVVMGGFSGYYSARCTMQGARCTVYGAWCTVHGAWCKVHVKIDPSLLQCIHDQVTCTTHDVWCTLHAAQCRVYVARCVWKSLYVEIYSRSRSVHGACCTVFGARYTFFFFLLTELDACKKLSYKVQWITFFWLWCIVPNLIKVIV